jgi:hypothetical protein
MEKTTWEKFAKTREFYRKEIKKLQAKIPELQALQQRLVDSRSPSYTVETPIVYNSALDDINQNSDIKLILVADNPGRREQAAENRRYLVGPSGKIADKFFRDNPVLGIDFKKNVIILNKTPIHTPRTIELKELCRLGADALETALAESQRLMVRILLEFHNAITVPVWITGYSEMKKGGVFEVYTNELRTIYSGTNLQDSVFLYRHFSMNQFTIDLNRQVIPKESLTQTLERIGSAYRQKFLW